MTLFKDNIRKNSDFRVKISTMIQKQRISLFQKKEIPEVKSKLNPYLHNQSDLTQNQSHNESSLNQYEKPEIDYYVKSDKIRISRFRDLLHAVLNIDVKKYEAEAMTVKRNKKKYDCFFNKTEINENIRKEILLKTLVEKGEQNSNDKNSESLYLPKKAFSSLEMSNKFISRLEQRDKEDKKDKSALKMDSIKNSKLLSKKVSNTKNEWGLTPDEDIYRISINPQISILNNKNLNQGDRTDLSLSYRANKKTVFFQNLNSKQQMELKEKEKENVKPKRIGFFCCS